MAGLSRFDVLKGKVLDVSKAEAGVQRVLLDREVGYSATNVSDVECNNGNDPEIKKGASFTCEVVVDGRKRQRARGVPGRQRHLRGGPTSIACARKPAADT